MKDNSMNVHHNNAEPWTVTLVDTGELTLTGEASEFSITSLQAKNFVLPTQMVLVM